MSNDRLETLMNQAEELMQARDYESAIAIFQQALEIDPNNTEVLRKCGKALAKNNQYPEAFKIFEEAKRIDPKNVKILSSYAKVLKEGGRLDECLEILKILVEDLEPNNPITLSSYAKELTLAGQHEKALPFFKRSLEIDQNNPKTLNSYVNALNGIGQHEKALEVLEKLVNIEPNNLITIRSYAHALIATDQYEKAFMFFDKALKIEPDNPITLNSYANALTATNQHEKAFIFFDKALKIEPDNPITLNSYANALTATNQYEKAFRFFDKALKIEPDNPITLSSYANALTATNQHEKAFQLFEQALKLEPNNSRTLRSYAHALTLTNQHEKAFQLFERLLEIEYNNPITLNSYAKSLISMGQYEKALPLFDRSLQIEPNNSITLNSYAKSLITTNQYKKASQLFKQSLQIEPNNPRTLGNYANALTLICEYEKALPFFEYSIKIEPDNAIILSRYAIALASNSQDEKALPFFEKALKVGLQNHNTRNNFIYFQYAPALERLGKYQEAINQLRAIKIEAMSQYEANIVLLNLGRLYYWIKQPEKGNEYFEAAIANSDDKEKTLLYSARSILANNPHNETAIAMLQQIEKDSPRYAQAKEMLTLNLSEEDYFEMVKTDVQSELSDTEMLNRAMYHKIANEISILKGIAYRISRRSEQEDPLLSGIIQDIEDVFEEVNKRRTAQKYEIETVTHNDYGRILAVISKTAHDISDFVNNELAVIESETRRAMRKLAPNDEHYTRFEKLLVQLELTQSALSDLKAINEGIKIKNHRFKVKELFEKWKTTCQIDNAWIILQIRNGDSQFYGDEEKIKSALNELVENSLKHNADQQKLTIHITSQDVLNPSGIRGMNIPGEQKYLLIEFADNGKGVPEYNKDWIFQPLKTTSQEGKGSGLGLFIIRKTLTQMNGYIRETGQDGARFEIYIPYVERDA